MSVRPLLDKKIKENTSEFRWFSQVLEVVIIVGLLTCLVIVFTYKLKVVVDSQRLTNHVQLTNHDSCSYLIRSETTWVPCVCEVIRKRIDHHIDQISRYDQGFHRIGYRDLRGTSR